MDRIAIVGCGGSGKSCLARSLGSLLGVMPVHLDGLYYDQNWRPLDKEQFAALQRDLVAAPRWIIDGNYASSLPIRLHATDTVIFLDLPAWTWLCGIGLRRMRYGRASTKTSVSTTASTGAWSGTSSATAAEWHRGSGS